MGVEGVYRGVCQFPSVQIPRHLLLVIRLQTPSPLLSFTSTGVLIVRPSAL